MACWLSTSAMYAAMASGLDMPLRLAHASHLARASSCTAQGCGVVLSPLASESLVE